MSRFNVEKIDPLSLESVPPLSEMYTLSPYIWREKGKFSLLLRAVPHSENWQRRLRGFMPDTRTTVCVLRWMHSR